MTAPLREGQGKRRSASRDTACVFLSGGADPCAWGWVATCGCGTALGLAGLALFMSEARGPASG